MNKRSRLLLTGLSVALVWGCLEDPTPDSVRLRLDGPAGRQVEVIFSTNFIAGINDDTGVTTVQVFSSDTITSTFPIDTVISILPNRWFFAQAMPLDTTELAVQIRVDAGPRNLFDGSGSIFTADPWRFVYLFNVNLLTSDVDVVI